MHTPAEPTGGPQGPGNGGGQACYLYDVTRALTMVRTNTVCQEDGKEMLDEHARRVPRCYGPSKHASLNGLAQVLRPVEARLPKWLSPGVTARRSTPP